MRDRGGMLEDAGGMVEGSGMGRKRESGGKAGGEGVKFPRLLGFWASGEVNIQRYGQTKNWSFSGREKRKSPRD